METARPSQIGIFMGRESDWETLRHAAATLDQFQVPWERRIANEAADKETVSQRVAHFVENGGQILIVGAAEDRTLAAEIANASSLPTLVVPLASQSRPVLESLQILSHQAESAPMATLAIGKAGATNAALLAVAILGNSSADLRERLRQYRAAQTARVQSEELI